MDGFLKHGPNFSISVETNSWPSQSPSYNSIYAKKLFHNIDLPIDKDLMYSNTKIIINQNDFKRKETNKEIKINL